MYVLIEKTNEKVSIFKELSPLALYLNVDRSTIYRNLLKNKWETNSFTLYKPDFIQRKSKRGGKK